MKDERTKNLHGRDKITRLVDFINEVGMLRKTPRTGYQFLGSGRENVAEHSFRTAVIGYVLAREAEADANRTVLMCLFHDLHEARTGDFNYVNKMYNRTIPEEALGHCLSGTGLEGDIMPLWNELEDAESIEAQLAQDADQLDFIFNLKEESDMGNAYADEWLEVALKRLRTDVGRAMGQAVVETDHKDWWFLGPDRDWWEKKNGK